MVIDLVTLLLLILVLALIFGPGYSQQNLGTTLLIVLVIFAIAWLFRNPVLVK